MQKIDAHQHFWYFDPVRDSWITDEMNAIQKDFLPKDLLPVLQQNGFDGCVAVQASQSEEETNFLLELADENSFIKGVVGWVDLQAENIADRLAYYKQFPKLKGFRHVLQGETDRALMLKPAFKRGIAALQKHNFTYDILIFRDQLKYAKELAQTFPNQKFVIDHLSKPDIKSGDIAGWEKDMRAIAAEENVYCKVSGMVTEADWRAWKQEDFTPYLSVVTEAFSVKRLMYGSDWPVCLVAGTYSEMFSIVKEYFSSFSAEEQAQFFGVTATQFYNL